MKKIVILEEEEPIGRGQVEIIIYEKEKPIGNACLGNLSNDFYLGYFYINPSAQGKGNGSKLIKAINSFLEEKQISARLINEIASDHYAHKIYKNNGWIEGKGDTSIMRYTPKSK